MLTSLRFNNAPIRLSPLQEKHQMLGAQFVDRAGWQLPEVYTSPEDEVTVVRERTGVTDVSANGKLFVKGNAADELIEEAFGMTLGSPGRISPAVPVDGGYIAQLTPDEFLVVTPPGVESKVIQRLEQKRVACELFVTVVNQTSGLAGLVVAGPDSRELLGKLCALPLASTGFPNHHVAQSSLAKVHVIIVRSDFGELPAYELYFDRPYGEYVWTSIIDAGHEFGITAFGLAAKELLKGV